MFTIYGAYANADMTEGRGPMVLDSLFQHEKDCIAYIDVQPGCMGRTGKWSIDPCGDWQLRPLHVFTSILDHTDNNRRAIRIRALAKLTPEEKVALSLDRTVP